MYLYFSYKPADPLFTLVISTGFYLHDVEPQ